MIRLPLSKCLLRNLILNDLLALFILASTSGTILVSALFPCSIWGKYHIKQIDLGKAINITPIQTQNDYLYIATTDQGFVVEINKDNNKILKIGENIHRKSYTIYSTILVWNNIIEYRQ